MMFVESGFRSGQPPQPDPGLPRRRRPVLIAIGVAAALAVSGSVAGACISSGIFGVSAGAGEATSVAAAGILIPDSFEAIAAATRSHPKLALLQEILCSRYETKSTACGNLP
ncbi:MAG TPA: hypothetical protein VFL98_01015 [Candidatus Paceibacterota bacterium]|nr:hypothetical protein [Candidatus Paceibacterota bacterium]